MATYKDFECRLQVPEADLGKLDELKKKLHGIIDSEDFTKTMSFLEANAAHAAAGPKSVSGEGRIYVEASSRGEARVGASLSIRF